MTAAIGCSVAAWLLVAVCAPWLSRRLPPAAAVRLLVACHAAVAASTLLVGAMVASTRIAQLPEVIEVGPWSPAALRANAPVSWPVAIGCALATGAAAAGGLAVLVRRLLAMRAVRRACAPCPAVDGLVVLPSDRVEAFSTPPPAGRVVVSTALLGALTGGQRQVILAHERSHLAHGHAWWVLAAQVSAAVNPMLRPAAAAVDEAVERWADEDAAAAVADRRLVARTLATTALLMHRAPAPGATLGAAVRGVPRRVAALLAPPPRAGRAATAALVALLLASCAGPALVQRRTDDLFDRAELPGAAHEHPGSAPPPGGAR